MNDFCPNYLQHHGILGQKWGVRRFESKGGKLTPAGKARYYGDSDSFKASNGVKVGAPRSKGVEAFRKFQGSKVGSATLNGMAKMNTALASKNNKAFYKSMEYRMRKENEAVRESNQAHKAAMKGEQGEKKGLSDKQKKAIKIGAAVVGTAVVAYGGYKLYQLNKKATEGMSAQFHKQAVANRLSANKLSDLGFDMHDRGFKVARETGHDSGNKLMQLGKSYMNEAGHHKDLADIYDFQANSKKYSIKDKYNYLKKGKVTDSALAKLTKSHIDDEQSVRAGIRTVKDAVKSNVGSTVKGSGYNVIKGKTTAQNMSKDLAKSLGASNSPVKSMNEVFGGTKIKGSKTFIDASKQNDDLVQELLKKNTLKF